MKYFNKIPQTYMKIKAFGIAAITDVTDITLVPEIENWENIFGTLNCVTFPCRRGGGWVGGDSIITRNA
jgi:hypothetical protein